MLDERSRVVTGVERPEIVDPFADPAGFEKLLVDRLATPRLSVIVARRPCVLAAADIRGWEKAAEASRASAACAGCATEDA